MAAARCAAGGDAPSAGAPRGEAIASYDYDAFLGERSGCCQRNNGEEPSKRTIENDIASSSAAKLAEAARRPPAIQAAPDVARLMDELGLARFLPLLLAEEAADMETLQCLEATDLKDLLLPLGARTKLLHALKRNPGWRPRHTR